VRQPTFDRKDHAMPAEISWFELPAADTAKARAFYAGLFGWGSADFGGDYHVIEGGPAGANAPREDGFTHPRVYFDTADVDASVKRIHELGGTSEDVRTVPGVGRIAHCRDDQGTPFSLYEPEARA
jgi:predicted enzyme related to lactoylglutathione lyase